MAGLGSESGLWISPLQRAVHCLSEAAAADTRSLGHRGTPGQPPTSPGGVSGRQGRTAGHQACVSPGVDTVAPGLLPALPPHCPPVTGGPAQHPRPAADWGLAASSPAHTPHPTLCVWRTENASCHSDAKSHPTLRSQGCSTPASSVLGCLLEFAQTPVCWLCLPASTPEGRLASLVLQAGPPETRGPSGSRHQPQLCAEAEHREPWVSFHHSHLRRDRNQSTPCLHPGTGTQEAGGSGPAPPQSSEEAAAPGLG